MYSLACCFILLGLYVYVHSCVLSAIAVIKIDDDDDDDGLRSGS